MHFSSEYVNLVVTATDRTHVAIWSSTRENIFCRICGKNGVCVLLVCWNIMKLVKWKILLVNGTVGNYCVKYVCRLALTGNQAIFKPCSNGSVTEMWDVPYLSFFFFFFNKLLAEGNWMMTFEFDWKQLETCQTISKGIYLWSMLFWN